MTVSEVTTRIALVGIVSLAGLMLVARRSLTRVDATRRTVVVQGIHSSARERLDLPGAPSRLGLLLIAAVISGTTLGVMLSSLMLLALTSTGIDA